MADLHGKRPIWWELWAKTWQTGSSLAERRAAGLATRRALLPLQALERFIANFEAGDGRLAAEDGVALELDVGEDAIVIVGFSVPVARRRQGLGKRALKQLCRAADAAGVTLEVTPEPLTLLVDEPIPFEKLLRIYERAGFSGYGEGLWVRFPIASADQEGGAKS